MQRSEWPTVTELYADRDIFITGASGFIGKCLLEKVLRSLNTSGRVFVLVRPKSGKSAQERIKDLTNAKVDVHFEHIKLYIKKIELHRCKHNKFKLYYYIIMFSEDLNESIKSYSTSKAIIIT